MIDDVTRFDNAWIEGADIFYQYSVLGIDNEQFDARKFDQHMSKQLTNDYCIEGDIRNLLELGKNLHFEYADERGQLITEIVISLASCN